MTSEQMSETDRRPRMGPETSEDDAEEWRKRAEEIFRSLPQPSIQPLPKEHIFDLSKYHNQLDCTPAEAWQKCADMIQRHDADNCKAYREEIDTLLVFAGLFSAVVTAFTIESYQWLQSDPNDAIIALLSQIAQPGNESRTVPLPKGVPDAVSARVNAYWFLSLTLGLSSALAAILCKQWVREFERHADRSHEEYIGVRQTKLEGFERWGVGAVVTTIPLLLQSALALFALGMIELLWWLHTAVAIVVIIPVLTILIFYAATTLLPGLQIICSPFGVLHTLSLCPFKSPQALLTLRLLALVCDRGSRVRSFWDGLVRRCRPGVHIRYDPIRNRPRWLGFLRQCRSYLPSIPCFRRWSKGRRAQHYFLRSDPIGKLMHPKTWTAFDRAFTELRDATYASDAYQKTRALSCPEDLPPMACFRGLLWLRDQIDTPGLRQWTWLCVWDIAAGFENRYGWEVQHIHLWHDIRRFTFRDEYIMNRKSTPSSLMVEYALYANIDPPFLAELFLHHIPSMDNFLAVQLWDEISSRLGRDNHMWRSTLHALLAHLLLTDPRERYKTDELWPVHDPRAFSQSELACMIALYFRDCCFQAVEGIEGSRRYLKRVKGTLTYLADCEGCPNESDNVKSVFSALVLAFDRWLERRTAFDENPDEILTELRREPVRKVYFYLLSSALDTRGPTSSGLAAAEAELARLQARVSSRRKERRLRCRHAPTLEPVTEEPTSPDTIQGAQPTDPARIEPEISLNIPADKNRTSSRNRASAVQASAQR